MNTKDVIKEIRQAAKDVGLTFRVQCGLTINNSPAYEFVIRGTNDRAMCNCTLASAYNNVCSGYISSWNKDAHKFEGVNHYA